MKNILLYASDLAACIGRNRYKSKNDMLKIYWKRIDPDSYSKHEFTVEIKDEIDKSIKKDEIRALIDAKPENTIVINEIVEKAGKVVDGHLDVRAVKEYVKSELYKKFGTDHEEHAARKLHVTKTNKFVKKVACEIFGTKVLIGGRLDGVDDKDEKVVEIKTRMRGLFHSIPEYEMVQLQAYMFVTGKHSGMLVEQYQDDMEVHEAMFDARLWDTINNGIFEFASELIKLLQNEEAQLEFVRNINEQCIFDSEED